MGTCWRIAIRNRTSVRLKVVANRTVTQGRYGVTLRTTTPAAQRSQLPRRQLRRQAPAVLAVPTMPHPWLHRVSSMHLLHSSSNRRQRHHHHRILRRLRHPHPPVLPRPLAVAAAPAEPSRAPASCNSCWQANPSHRRQAPPPVPVRWVPRHHEYSYGLFGGFSKLKFRFSVQNFIEYRQWLTDESVGLIYPTVMVEETVRI